MPYGRTVLGTSGSPLTVLASDHEDTNWKLGGITLDWDTVTAVSADTTLLDGNVIKNGKKYLRYGQILTIANTAEVQTWTWTGGPTSGGAVLRMPAYGAFPACDTASIAYNATAAQFETALQALENIGTNGVTVTRSGAGTAGDPYIYTCTFARQLGNLPQMTKVTHTFGGGTSPDATPGTTTAGTGTGKYGPYDSAASDGRQTLTRGFCFVLNETVAQEPPLGWGAPNADNPGVFDGGLVWRDRLLITPTTHGLAVGPTIAEFEAAFPNIRYADL